MSDLELGTSSDSIEDLLSKYKDGNAPEASIVVDGTDLIADKNAAIEKIEVDMSMTKASMCVFTIVNGYSIKERKYFWTSSLLKNGKEVTVKCGYGDTKKEVFNGYIETVSIKASDSIGGDIEVVAYDKSYNMRRAKKTTSWTEMTYTKVVEEIGGNYGLTVDADDTSTELPLIVQKDMKDFDFIEELAGEVGYHVMVLGDNLYFKDFSDSGMQDNLVTLKSDEHLLKFDGDKNSANQVSKVIVSSYNHKDREDISVEVDTATQLNTSDDSGASVVDEMDSENCIEEIYCAAETEADAKRIGELFLNGLSSSFMTGSGSAIGFPDIIPGRYIKIDGYGEPFDASYCVTEAKHTLDHTGYTTTFKYGEEKKTTKSQKKTSEKMYGFYLAEVTGMGEDNEIIVKMPSRKFEEISVSMMTTSTGVEAGHVFFPTKGDQVLLGYLEGDVSKPYVMGCVWDSTNTAPITVDEDNFTKMIRTPGGNELQFYDEEGKEKVTLKSKSGHILTLDDENKKVSLEDSKGSNTLVIDSDSGEVSLDAEKKITLTVGGVSIEIDGSGGKIAINSTNNLEIKSTNITIEAQASLKIKGGAEVGVESSGMLNLKGSMTKIN